jgi:hypothetical protein
MVRNASSMALCVRHTRMYNVLQRSCIICMHAWNNVRHRFPKCPAKANPEFLSFPARPSHPAFPLRLPSAWVYKYKAFSASYIYVRRSNVPTDIFRKYKGSIYFHLLMTLNDE